MKNPTVEKNYTTIFADGSIIHENPWLMFDDGHGKWYWDEEIRGGVIAWNEIPEGGYNYHHEYKIPDWELEGLLKQTIKFQILENKNMIQHFTDKEWFEKEQKEYFKEIIKYYNTRYLIR